MGASVVARAVAVLEDAAVRAALVVVALVPLSLARLVVWCSAGAELPGAETLQSHPSAPMAAWERPFRAVMEAAARAAVLVPAAAAPVVTAVMEGRVASAVMVARAAPDLAAVGEPSESLPLILLCSGLSSTPRAVTA